MQEAQNPNATIARASTALVNNGARNTTPLLTNHSLASLGSHYSAIFWRGAGLCQTGGAIATSL